MEIKTIENLLTTKSRGSGSASVLRCEQSKCTQQICPKKEKNKSMYKQAYLKKANVYYHVA